MKLHRSLGMRMRAIVRPLAAAAVFCPLVALASDSGKRVNKADSARASEALARWLGADCEHASLKSLMPYRGVLVADLVAVLNKGPSFDSRERVRQAAEESYEELVEQARRRPERRVASSRDEYVKRDLDNFDAQYRVRAAQILAVIGSPEARRALENALRQIEREDVRMTIQALLKIKAK